MITLYLVDFVSNLLILKDRDSLSRFLVPLLPITQFLMKIIHVNPVQSAITLRTLRHAAFENGLGLNPPAIAEYQAFKFSFGDKYG